MCISDPFSVIYTCIIVNNSSKNFLGDGLLNSRDRMVFVLSKGMFDESMENNEQMNNWAWYMMCCIPKTIQKTDTRNSKNKAKQLSIVHCQWKKLKLTW